MAKEGIFKKITRRFKRIEEPLPVKDEQSKAIVDTLRQALDPKAPCQETYSCDGREYVHVRFPPLDKVIKKDPITRTFKKIKCGDRTTQFYTKDGKLLQ